MKVKTKYGVLEDNPIVKKLLKTKPMNIDEQIILLIREWDLTSAITTEQLVSQIKQSILKAIMDRLDILMPEERIEEIEGNLNIYFGEKKCTVCGADPRRQKFMILSVIKDLLSPKQSKTK